MKKELITLILGFSVAISSFGQIKTDTLYYDRDWKGVESEAFATYFRVIAKTDDTNYRKRYRDYYITGELQSEGGYITIDRYDDSKSVFDGEWTNYYKSGKIKSKGNRIRGKAEGEYIRYKENGLIERHAYFREGKLHGVMTEFSEDGNTCYQTEYYWGEPKYHYYIVSNQDGFCSKVKFSDGQPVYESPSYNEQKTEYKNGVKWVYYNKDGIMVGTKCRTISDYGKYYQISIIIANNSMFPFDFDPGKVTALLMDKRGDKQTLATLSAAEYMKKVRRRQNWASALYGLAEGLNAANAGYSSSMTNTYYNGYSRETGGYHGYATSTTTSYNAAAAYQAQLIASDRIADYDNTLLSERAIKEEGYLKKTTIYPGETISGYIHVERKKGETMNMDVDINGVIYPFSWNVGK